MLTYYNDVRILSLWKCQLSGDELSTTDYFVLDLLLYYYVRWKAANSGIMNFSSGDQNKRAADFDGFWRTDEREDQLRQLPWCFDWAHSHTGRWIVRITVMAFAHWRGFNFFDLVSSDADSGEVRQALNVSVTPTFMLVVCCSTRSFLFKGQQHSYTSGVPY